MEYLQCNETKTFLTISYQSMFINLNTALEFSEVGVEGLSNQRKNFSTDNVHKLIVHRKLKTSYLIKYQTLLEKYRNHKFGAVAQLFFLPPPLGSICLTGPHMGVWNIKKILTSWLIKLNFQAFWCNCITRLKNHFHGYNKAFLKLKQPTLILLLRPKTINIDVL